MRPRALRSLRCAMLLAWITLPASAPLAQEPARQAAADSARAAVRPDSGVLVLHGQRIAVFRSALGAASPAERAAAAAARLRERVERGTEADSVHHRPVAGGQLLLIGDTPVFLLADADADPLLGETSAALAASAAGRLREALAAEREERSFTRLVTGIALALLATVAFAIALRAIVWVRRRVFARLSRDAFRHFHDLGVGGFTLVSTRQLVLLLRRLLELAFWAAGLFLAYLWLVFVLAQFPYSRPWGEALGSYLAATIRTLALTAISGIPGLFTVVIILVVTRWVARVVGAFFDAVETGTVAVPWVHPDTANPTKRIAIALLWLFAVVVSYPYLPGSGSDVFKGVSVFVGVVLSLGSTGVVNQAMSGLVLMYSRALKPGDFVRVGEIEGTVSALGLLSTKIATTKCEEVTIPNAVVVSTNVRNYSRDVGHRGVILPTSVTIGYDTPWRQVEAMLLDAARRTPGVNVDPAPFVLIPALQDFYVEYELNAHLAAAADRNRVRSALHANIVDVFNEHGVQIMSPHYEAEPSRPAVVPREQWYRAPARPPEPPGPADRDA